MAAEPQTLGRYRVERVLGRGAMGVVYEAHDPKLHRQVAIKTILVNQLDEQTAKDFSIRFEREAHAVARLNHPNIVQVYDFGEEGGVAYLVMEFIRGNELKTALATGANRVFERGEGVRIMCELLEALDFAHEAGVVHRDIKPANVMLDSRGRTKLTDFGVARVTDADRTNAERTQAGTLVGTPAYMSPEQIQGHRVDRRTDIFSAGIILYQFLTGQKPFTGEGAWTVAKKIIQDEPATPSSLNVEVPREYDRVVARALAKNPEERFATAKDFALALRRAAEGEPAFLEQEAPTVVVRREVDRTVKLSGGLPPAAPVRRKALPFVPGMVVLAALAGAAGYYLAARPGAEAPESGAKRAAEARAQGDADAKAAAELRAKQDAASRAKREAEARARREAEAKAKREAEARAQQEAEARAKAQREAEAAKAKPGKSKSTIFVPPTF